jgi:hypothetical protein
MRLFSHDGRCRRERRGWLNDPAARREHVTLSGKRYRRATGTHQA